MCGSGQPFSGLEITLRKFISVSAVLQPEIVKNDMNLTGTWLN